jgi:hypothetical protein
MQSSLLQPDNDLPFRRDPDFLGRDTVSGIECWVIQQLLPDIPADHNAFTVNDPGDISIVLVKGRT